MKKNYIPDGYNAVIPALAFHGAAAAIKWYVNVFGAKEKMRMDNPDKTVAHAEISIGDNVIMLSEENLQYNTSPLTLKGNSVNLCVYVPDVDDVIKKAVDNGAKLIMKGGSHNSSGYKGVRRWIFRVSWSWDQGQPGWINQLIDITHRPDEIVDVFRTETNNRGVADGDASFRVCLRSCSQVNSILLNDLRNDVHIVASRSVTHIDADIIPV